MNNNFEPDYPEVKRTYTPEEAGHEKRRRPVSRYDPRRLRRKRANPGVVLLVLLFCAISAICIYLIAGGKNKEKVPDIIPETSAVQGDSLKEPVAETTDDGLWYKEITVPRSEMNCGDLILVNSQWEYYFPDAAESEVTDIKSVKNDYYGLSSYSTGLARHVVEQFNVLCTDYYNYSGFKWMQINSAYRSKQEQIDLYADYTAQYGADYAKAYVANPGFSEHHTGLAMDLNVNVDGSIYYVENYEGCDWFRENAKNYGFILRYPKDKVYMTGINYESWHYRYVGTPHSQIMSDMNFCLEEYINYLRSYTWEKECLTYNGETGVDTLSAEKYEEGVLIYYTPAEEEGDTTLRVPKNGEYTVSGNNVDGFVVTVSGK